MSKRLIDSDLFQSADLLDQRADARLLFAGLIVNADDEGIGRADPGFLKNKILPGLRTSHARITQLLRSFEARNMLTLRIFNGATCYVVNNFLNYQRLKRPRPSKYAVPEEKGREGKRIEEKTMEAEDRDDARAELSSQVEKQQTHGPDPDSGRRPLRDMKFGNPYDGDFNPNAAELVDAIARKFNMGYAKAGIVVNEIGVDLEDWNAWKEYESKNGTRLAVMNIQRFKNPADIPAEVLGEAPKSFKQKDVDDAKSKAKTMREKKKVTAQDLENRATNGGTEIETMKA